MVKASKAFCNLTLASLVAALIICILATFLNEMLLPTHWIWPTIYYFVHSKCIIDGHLIIIDQTQMTANGDGEKVYNFGDINDKSPLSTIIIKDARYFRHVVLDIDVGLGESFVYGYWETDDIAQYLRLLFLNYKNKESQFYFYYLQFFSFSQWFNIINYYYNSNHNAFDDAQNIHHHYDWGTQLFESFLDDTMTYTAANFDNINNPTNNLKLAQINKVDRLIKKLNVQTNDNILEIGFGFGYLASYLLNNTNANSVTGITLSHDQLEYANNKYCNNNNNTKLKYLYRDYRDYIDGKQQFDGIISVEMIEAIGHKSIDTYFETVSNSLKPGGRFVIQYGAYSTWAFPDYYKENGMYFPTFVVKHIFPAHFEPDEQDIHASALKHGLELIHSEKFGLHYAKTLEIWLNNLINAKEEVISIFGQDVYRKFKYYLAWSQAVYQTQILHEVQAIFVKTNVKDIGQNLENQMFTM